VLDLIEKRKLLINDMTLASLTDEFVEYVRRQTSFPIEETIQFLSTASTLLLIKSASLIPDLDLTEEEREDVEDLTCRIAHYEQICEAAREIGRHINRFPMFSGTPPAHKPIFSPGIDLTSKLLLETILAMLVQRKQETVNTPPETRVQKIISLEDIMDRLVIRIQSAFTLSFREFSGLDIYKKKEIIVSFLALLELVKQGAIEATQYDRFGDICMTNTMTDAIPRYGDSQ